ncbi:MAG: hypothetical protein ACRDTA_02810 [Pseudonocardiaceae bacterium]
MLPTALAWPHCAERTAWLAITARSVVFESARRVGTPQWGESRVGVAMNTHEEFAKRLDALCRASGKACRTLAAESGLGSATISGYCTGRHLPGLSVGREFSRLLTAIGVPVGEEQDEFFDALAALRARKGRAALSTGNPYRGLRAFQREDADVFFGRKELTERLLSELADCRVRGIPLVVVGPSGSGKSSLLRAGLLPAVGSSVLMTPGMNPLREWAQHATGAAGDAVVVVDQFEELFTLCADEGERLRFLAALDRGPRRVRHPPAAHRRHADSGDQPRGTAGRVAATERLAGR